MNSESAQISRGSAVPFCQASDTVCRAIIYGERYRPSPGAASHGNRKNENLPTRGATHKVCAPIQVERNMISSGPANRRKMRIRNSQISASIRSYPWLTSGCDMMLTANFRPYVPYIIGATCLTPRSPDRPARPSGLKLKNERPRFSRVFRR